MLFRGPRLLLCGPYYTLLHIIVYDTVHMYVHTYVHTFQKTISVN